MISETKKIEINLKRLITSCEKIISEDDRVNVANGDGEMKPIVIDNTFTVEKYIPIMLSLFMQLEEKYSEQTKQQQQQLQQQQQQQSPFQMAKQAVTLSSPLSSPKSTTPQENEDTFQLTKEILNEYSRKIDVIVGLVNKGKLNSPISTKPSIIRLQASNLTHNKKMNEIHTVMKTRNKQEQKKIDLLIPNNSGYATAGGSGSNINSDEYSSFRNTNSNTYSDNTLPQQTTTVNYIKTTSPNNTASILSPTIKYRNKFQNTNSQLKSLLGDRGSKFLNLEEEEDIDEDSFEKRTQEQRKLQENFAEELLGLSKNLKNHSSDMSRKLNEEDKKIDKLNQLMDTSSSKIDRQNQNLKDYTSRSTRDTLNYCLIIVFVLILFIVSYLVIKFFSKS
ncbi:hypothetical protein DICPUDRAFT_153352 [Dictyostelium purpureum]|uniref:t-SNARE coiled-coil homology domain-containing protein n=1 Tax=Dictyostelium purpureum TaxID=5786 RepID=F0ZNP1_DICPU|nr:uncharacterized protein DICPUDRAFT_153352 [Dictyostelium purpureum]EGC34456.1 hypothetical protein DICPUDRAFT_153352 [Dictyostelium purpureum]|eukprot:XP_003289041.1 hypothetical protein DICPUDRAFT_153352 [Dictyostelium purpureum]